MKYLFVFLSKMKLIKIEKRFSLRNASLSSLMRTSSFNIFVDIPSLVESCKRLRKLNYYFHTNCFSFFRFSLFIFMSYFTTQNYIFPPSHKFDSLLFLSGIGLLGKLKKNATMAPQGWCGNDIVKTLIIIILCKSLITLLSLNIIIKHINYVKKNLIFVKIKII